MQPSTPHMAVWPGRTFATGGRPLRVDMPGGRLVFGRTAALAMPHASGRSNEFLSRRAVQVGLDRRGRPYVANLSARHEVVVRPWGRGASSDESLGAAVDASGPVRYLTSGWHWVRNGRPWDSAGRRYGTLRGDDRSSWLLLEVVDAAPAVSVPADTWTGTATFGQTGRPREWQLNDPQYRAVLVYFATYLGWPPAIAPEIPSDTTAERLALRQEQSASLLAELHAWLTEQLGKLSRNHDLAKAINYMLRRWAAFSRFLDDGRVCLTNNAAERALRCVPLGRKAWLFCGSDRGGQRAAILYTLIQTARLNDIDPQAWLADVLDRIASHPVSRLDELLPWNWQSKPAAIAA